MVTPSWLSERRHAGITPRGCDLITDPRLISYFAPGITVTTPRVWRHRTTSMPESASRCKRLVRPVLLDEANEPRTHRRCPDRDALRQRPINRRNTIIH